MCLCFTIVNLKLQKYVDANLAVLLISWKSTTCFAYTLGDTAMSWGSNLQMIVASSTTETKYVVVFEASKEIIWLQIYLEELVLLEEYYSLHVLYTLCGTAVSWGSNLQKIIASSTIAKNVVVFEA